MKPAVQFGRPFIAHLRAPKTKADWKEIANQFQDLWNFPHVVGAIDRKHVTIKCPLKGGSQYYNNYKGFFSIFLLAICDAHYAFTLVGIGEYGSNNDSGIFSNSEMGKLFHSEKMNLPDVESLGSGTTILYHFSLLGMKLFP